MIFRILPLVLAVLFFPATSGPQFIDAWARPAPGQSVTLLPDGRWLLVGGQTQSGPRADAALWDPRTGATVLVQGRLATPRARHTATLLADGHVLIVGGVGPDGRPTTTVERFDATAERFEVVAARGLTPRADHTATVLTDGRLLVAGGVGLSGTPLSRAEIWDPGTAVAAAGTGLTVARARHEATLLPDGTVLLWGGVDAGHARLFDGDLYDPAQDQVIRVTIRPPSADPLPVAPQLEAALPVDGAVGVPIDVVIALRFSKPLRVETVHATTVLLSGPRGVEPVTVVPAESGRLAFITPESALDPGTSYTLSLNGPVDVAGFLFPLTAVRFTTAGTAGGGGRPGGGEDDGTRGGGHHGHHGDGDARLTRPGEPAELDEWEWKGERRKGKPYSRWQELPPLQAPPGVTALAGQVLRLNGQPLADVTIRIAERTARTDDTGRFLATDIPSGYPTMQMDGSTANRRGKTYAMFDVGVKVKAGQTNVLPYTIWLPLIDTQHATAIPVPTPHEIVATTPRVPGLEMRIPAGVVLRSPHTGRPLREVTLTQIPVDRPPFPLPEGTEFFFTPQTLGADSARVERPDGSASPAGVRFIMPTLGTLAPAWRVDLQSYIAGRGWVIYGQGTVTGEGRQIVPDPGVEFHIVGCVHINGSGAPGIGPILAGALDGDPVDLATGLFVMEKTDLMLPDVIPIVIRRTYRQNDSVVRPFGRGMSSDLHVYIAGDNVNYSYADLVLGDGSRIHLPRISPGTSYLDAVYEHTATPTAYYKARMVWNAVRAGYDLTLRDGTVYEFIPAHGGSALVGIRDRLGNRLILDRGTDPLQSRILRATSPSGRWVEFTYGIPANNTLVTQVRDNLGRTVSYTYDASYRMLSVTDAGGGVTEYAYDIHDRMLTVKDARQIVYLTTEYSSLGTGSRVIRQTHADQTTYEFAYTVDGNGKVIQTDVTNPRGHVRRVTFNGAGYPLTDTHAHGTALAQTISYVRDATSNRPTSVTDALGRRTDFTYDTMGNVLTVTRLAGTGGAVTTTFTYEPTFNQVASVTDPLNHTTTFDRDAKGNVTTITNPLLQPTTLTYNLAGQPLTVTTPAGTTTLGYEMGDLASITDPTGKTTKRFTDPAGRLLAVTSPLGQRTRHEYDNLNQLRKIIDPLGGQTQFTYDPNGNLQTVTDARNSVTSYIYNNMDRLQTRTDPLLRPETYTYDNNGNLATLTDRKSQATNQIYDALDRLTQVTYADQSTTTYTWDAGNRLTQVVDSISGTISRTYDLLDRLTQEVTPQGTVSYTYDAASRRTSMTVAGQPTVTYGYDNADRLTSSTQGSNVVSFAYDTAGRRTTLTLPSNVITEYAYDAASRLTGLTYKHGSNTLGSLTYSYDSNTQRRRIAGSWARTGLPQAVPSATYNAANHQLTFGGQTLSYDLNGNLTGDGTLTYTWDERNRLAGITGATSASFGYDALGRRAQKNINGGLTTVLYDGLNPVQESAGGGVTNLLTALGLDEFLLRTEAAGARNLLADGLGSTVALTDSAGAVVTEYAYEPFGMTTATGGSSPNELQFTGRENDGIGLYYYRARYYHPGLQRFISEDPIGFAGGDINLYAYLGNDPINDTDPLGEFGLAGCGAGILSSVLFDAGGYLLSGRKPSFGEVLSNAAWGCASGAVGAGLLKLAPKLLGSSRVATRVFRLGDEAGAAGITLDQARAAATRAGIDMRMFSLASEAGKNYGFISLTGSGAIVRDATGRFVLTLQQAGLASERAAVQTIAHELNHIRGILQTGRATSEVVAERAAQLAGWFFR